LDWDNKLKDWDVKNANISLYRTALRTSSALVIAAAIGAPAFAQDAAQPAQDEVASETIVVTGSRIARRDLQSTSPLAVVSNEEFELSGTVNVEQVINTLPQVVPGLTSASNNPGNGTATLDLRGLGSARTMVIVNGRRWMFFDTSQRVDLNTIPQFLIEGVDIVTGGASAVYGSDALSGVVNFRLRNDVNGIEAGTQYSITEEGDGARWDVYTALGTDFDDGRGHITAFGEYFKRKSIFQDARGFSTFALTDDGAGGFVPGGSGTGQTARAIYAGGANANFEPDDVPGNFEDAFFENGTSRPRVSTDAYNYAPANYLQIPQERWLLGTYGDYEINDFVTAYTELAFVNNRVEQELAATPVTGNFNLDIAQNCAFMSAADCAALQAIDAGETAANGAAGETDDPGVVNMFLTRRTLETGPRNTFDERNAFRALFGLKGPISDTLSYDAYYMYARTRNANIQRGNISASAFQAGLDGTASPINIWGEGSLTPAMVDQISILAQNNDISVMQVASGNVNGSLFNFGMGADDVGFAVGAEWRSVSSRFVPDTALSSGDVIGFNAGDATAGAYNVKEVFGELRVPIIADAPGVERLEVNGALRYSDYSLDAVGGVWTYAAGAEYAPISDITFRGQYQRAIRAPNVGELFGGQSVGFPPATDPCALPGAATDATVRAVCEATGVPASRVGDESIQLNSQIPGIFGGNPDLQEETSDTYTVGAIIQPRFVPGLNMTVDYYNIKIEDVISTLGGGLGNTLNLCYNVIQDPNSVYCQAVNRNPLGQISGDNFSVEILNANIGKLETSGVDFQVDYMVPMDFSFTGAGESRLNFFVLGTWTDKFDITPVADLPDQVNNCAGRFGILACGSPIPEWKWTSRVSYLDGPFTTSVRWRHIGSVNDDDPDTEYSAEKIDAYDLFDLTLSYDITESFGLTAGVNNLFNKKPQLLGDNQEQANTYPSVYDTLGRDYFISANFKF
jgi:outer membrane receptor protein involved in Fe transport